MGPVYLVNDRPQPVIRRLKEAGLEVLVGNDEYFNEDYLARCTVLMSGRGHVTRETLEKAPNLKLICKQGVGLDRIDLAACAERGIRVCNTPDSNAISVAEHTMALLLACAKQLYPISNRIRCEMPDSGCARRYRSAELSGKTLAVIGYGNIGRRVTAMAKAFDLRMIVCVRHPERYPDEEGITFTASLQEAISCADYISLHVSGTEENRALIGRKELNLMKPTAILINTTRGFVVDEEALIEALEQGKIAGAGLDVFTTEPLEAGNRLLALENVVATPHTAANTAESNLRAYQECARIILDFAKTER